MKYRIKINQLKQNISNIAAMNKIKNNKKADMNMII